MAVTGKETPMARQWREMKAGLPEDVLLFFRVGDFYELFDDDAERAAAVLELTLTRRSERPLAGVPHHAVRDYLARALAAGFRVALADQVGEVKPGKLVEREITQIISASTVLDGNLLDAGRGNWLAAVQRHGEGFALAALDHSTGEFQLELIGQHEALLAALARLQPAELLYPEPQRALFAELVQQPLRMVDAHAFEAAAATRLLREHFGVASLDGFGLNPSLPGSAALSGAAGAALHYLTLILQQSARHLRPPRLLAAGSTVTLDLATLQSLEVIDSRSGRGHSLLGAMDRTQTASGARLLRSWLSAPSREAAEIRARQDLVAPLVHDAARRGRLRLCLKRARDIERASARLSQGSGNARDLAALAESLAIVPEVVRELKPLAQTEVEGENDGTIGSPCRAAHLLEELPDLAALRQRLDEALADELPLTLRDGGLIRDGVHPELDELRAAVSQGRDWLAELQQREALATGIKTLKVRYNAVFGYFLEVSKSQQGKVPPGWVRKQTTANAERFVTEELKRLEEKILGAEERAKALEYQLFLELRELVLAELPWLQRMAAALAQLDLLTSFAELAANQGWVRPEVVAEPSLEIQAGRHPVLDILSSEFIPNGLSLDPATRRLMLVTGPNMAGKSTYIRQSALLVLLAQTGSFVPATAMSFGLADRIFARVGAADDLARGQSTFMVEMAETAAILHQATENSLVILDEIGRGTATWDGLSLAWSIAEFLHDEIRARTLFATHYHELTAITQRCPAVVNAQVAVRESGGQIVFLHRIVEGSADKSYGIQVARLAGLPEPVLERARHLLQTLEAGNERLVLADAEIGSTSPARSTRTQRKPRPGAPAAAAPQPDLFG